MNSKRIGPKMLSVVSFVSANPGCSMLDAARYVGPRGSLKFGYRSVHRTLDAGLIEAFRPSNGRRKYDLFVSREQYLSTQIGIGA